MRLNVGTLEAAKRSFYELGRHLFMGSYFGIRCDFCGKTKYIEGEYLLRKLNDDNYKCNDCVQREQNEKMRRRVYHTERVGKNIEPKQVVENTASKTPPVSNLEKYGGKIIVTMTSWKKRIGNCVKVINTILDQTVRPDTVFLNLSSEEFENKEDDLPKDLLLMRDKNKNFIINWVDGENTKCMKKVFPVLQFLDDEDFIINTDDDILMPRDLIESRMKEWKKYRRPITGNNSPRWHYRKKIDGYACGNCSLMKKKMLNGWEEICSNEVIHTYNDDEVYALLMYFNGYKFKPCETYSRYTGTCVKKLGKFNDTEPLGKNGGFLEWQKVYEIVENRLNEITRFNNIKYAYGYMMEKIDFVIPYVVSKKGFSTAITKYRFTELEYTIKSIRKFCAWSGRIFVATNSELPDSVLDNVTVIEVGDPYTHIKDANIINKIKTVIDTVPDLSKTFIVASDDQIVTKPSIIRDFLPRVAHDYTGNLNKYKTELSQMPKGSQLKKWHIAMYNTLKKFKNRSYFYEPHIWTPIDKDMFIEMCQKYDIAHDDGIIIFTLYNNFTCQEKRMDYDHVYFGDRVTRYTVLNSLNDMPRHVAWTDKTFNMKDFRAYLYKTVFK